MFMYKNLVVVVNVKSGVTDILVLVMKRRIIDA